MSLMYFNSDEVRHVRVNVIRQALFTPFASSRDATLMFEPSIVERLMNLKFLRLQLKIQIGKVLFRRTMFSLRFLIASQLPFKKSRKS
jgi:hypothetical protein